MVSEVSRGVSDVQVEAIYYPPPWTEDMRHGLNVVTISQWKIIFSVTVMQYTTMLIQNIKILAGGGIIIPIINKKVYIIID